MPYTKDASAFWLDVTSFPETDVHYNVSIDNPGIQVPAGVKIIAIQCEPNDISHARDAFISNHTRYDMLLTFDDEILKRCPNARFVPFGTTWLCDGTYKAVDVLRKTPKISTIVGLKEMTPNHTFRKMLYFNQKCIPLPITWFRSSRDGGMLEDISNNPILNPTSKEDLFLDYQFSLIIENSTQKNYFSEKLIDCLLMKTIPIYYGCVNIDDFFDTTGWIRLESRNMDDLIQKCNPLPKYETYVDIIDKNYQTAITYIHYHINIRKALV